MIEIEGGGIFTSMLVQSEILNAQGPNIGNILNNEPQISENDRIDFEREFVQNVGDDSTPTSLGKMQIIQALGQKFLAEKTVEVTSGDGTATVTLRELHGDIFDAKQRARPRQAT